MKTEKKSSGILRIRRPQAVPTHPGGTKRRVAKRPASKILRMSSSGGSVFKEIVKLNPDRPVRPAYSVIRRENSKLRSRKGREYPLGNLAHERTPFAELPQKTSSPKVPAFVRYAPGVEEVVQSSRMLAQATLKLSADVQFSVSTPTVTGKRLAQIQDVDTVSTDDYFPDLRVQERLIHRMAKRGFALAYRGMFTLTFSGSVQLIERELGIRLWLQVSDNVELAGGLRKPSGRGPRRRPEDLFFAPCRPEEEVSRVEGIDSIYFPSPLVWAAAVPVASSPPPVSYHSADSAAIRAALNVPEMAYKGEGVSVAVIDSGFWMHPFFQGRPNYCPTPTTRSPKPGDDPVGHGTAMAMNLFATAPDATLKGYRQTRAPDNAFEDAMKGNPHIVSCSWGVPTYIPLQILILRAISSGIIVLFAAGNGSPAWPGSMPEVISVGGVYVDKHNQRHASDMANGYTTPSGRAVPDICGLCGMKPEGIHIVAPTSPGSTFDKKFGGVSWPLFDETGTTDGWVGISGTSSATAQVAGVVALLIEKAQDVGKKLDQNAVKSILCASGQQVLFGKSAQGQLAGPKPSAASGSGLTDAAAALARV
ncbi:S8 family serine peptidase [Paraburkholderia aspalathi]|uniref:Subtilase family protein n=1 Tax=Paraburkholderia aspalathi TaxID=1324617 RepID=A0A1I7CLN9_9BURK|nr:S8 family serine peptidase [Paraburkholderia aspalathi]SFU00361.1 Subtilase family protein [Paraburkholderia aspalathi]